MQTLFVVTLFIALISSQELSATLASTSSATTSTQQVPEDGTVSVVDATVVIPDATHAESPLATEATVSTSTFLATTIAPLTLPDEEVEDEQPQEDTLLTSSPFGQCMMCFFEEAGEGGACENACLTGCIAPIKACLESKNCIGTHEYGSWHRLCRYAAEAFSENESGSCSATPCDELKPAPNCPDAPTAAPTAAPTPAPTAAPTPFPPTPEGVIRPVDGVTVSVSSTSSLFALSFGIECIPCYMNEDETSSDDSILTSCSAAPNLASCLANNGCLHQSTYKFHQKICDWINEQCIDSGKTAELDCAAITAAIPSTESCIEEDSVGGTGTGQEGSDGSANGTGSNEDDDVDENNSNILNCSIFIVFIRTLILIAF